MSRSRNAYGRSWLLFGMTCAFRWYLPARCRTPSLRRPSACAMSSYNEPAPHSSSIHCQERPSVLVVIASGEPLEDSSFYAVHSPSAVDLQRYIPHDLLLVTAHGLN
ncbi:hypothetical protein OH76DRAFT_1404607 [Lentinus brumalis]|uniref:Uncharacterized protein n=1 Tax=Lentinus brumalis TaxID=2498619 RepID=A0A371D810_9APHY|nr:hypothetical protein OH76DRAFT_1404607 [Polyporus brumalis]